MATLRQLAASLSESEKGLFTEYPYPNRDQEIAGITRDKKKQIKERKILFNKLKAHNFGGVFKKMNTCADPKLIPLKLTDNEQETKLQ